MLLESKWPKTNIIYYQVLFIYLLQEHSTLYQVSLHQNNYCPKAFAKTDRLLWQTLITLESCGKSE